MAKESQGNPSIRDQEIIADLRSGMTGREVSRKYGLTPGRISQIAKGSLDTEGPPEELRDWLTQGYVGDLRGLQEIASGPGRAITSGKGEHVIDAVTGEPAYDPSPRIDAFRNMGQVRKNIATLLGTEKPPVKPVEEHPEMGQALEWLKETAAANERLRVENEKLQARLALLENAHPAEIVELEVYVQIMKQYEEADDRRPDDGAFYRWLPVLTTVSAAVASHRVPLSLPASSS